MESILKRKKKVAILSSPMPSCPQVRIVPFHHRSMLLLSNHLSGVKAGTSNSVLFIFVVAFVGIVEMSSCCNEANPWTLYAETSKGWWCYSKGRLNYGLQIPRVVKPITFVRSNHFSIIWPQYESIQQTLHTQYNYCGFTITWFPLGSGCAICCG